MHEMISLKPIGYITTGRRDAADDNSSAEMVTIEFTIAARSPDGPRVNSRIWE